VIINSIDLQTMIGLIAADALDEVTTYLSAEVEKLARAGADVALFASNTPHIVFDGLQRQSRIPLVSIIDATVRRRPLDGPNESWDCWGRGSRCRARPIPGRSRAAASRSSSLTSRT
jgi:hypothetical protein